MAYVPFAARSAPIHRISLCFELRVLLQELPSIVLRLVGLLRLPRVLLASVVFRVRLKRWNLVEVFVSFVAHVLFLCCVVVLSEESRLRQLHFDAIASLVVILLVELEADEVAFLFYTSNGGGAAAHTIV